MDLNQEPREQFGSYMKRLTNNQAEVKKKKKSLGLNLEPKTN